MSNTLAQDIPFSVHREGRAAAFLAARRHTRRVRVLRLAIPAIAIFMTAGFIAAVVLDARAPLSVRADAESLGVSGAAVTMEHPRLTGYSNDSRSYEVNAGRAEQSLTEPNRVDLVELNARLQIRDNGWAQILAPAGRFDTEAQQLRLDDNVEITTDRGDRAHLGQAEIDLGTGRILSPKPVDIAIGNANLTADSMEVLDNGDRMLFQGRVVMTLHPQQSSEPAAGLPEEASVGQ